jgi:hypothetical protein
MTSLMIKSACKRLMGLTVSMMLVSACMHAQYIAVAPGTISTIAGIPGSTTYGGATCSGAATGCSLYGASHTSYKAVQDNAGNIYFADGSNNVVRKLTPVTAPGTGSNLYGGNTTYTISTVAGTGSSASYTTSPACPGGPTAQNLSNGVVSWSQGDGCNAVTYGVLSTPYAVALDSLSSPKLLFIADTNHFRIRAVNLTGSSVTFTAGAYNISIAAGNIVTIVSSTSGNSISAPIDPAGSLSGSSEGVSSTLHGISGDGAGNILIADAVDNSIRKVSNASGANLTTILGGNTTSAVIGVGTACSTTTNNYGSAPCGDGSSPAPATTGTSTNAVQFKSPEYAMVDASGNYYISEPGDYRIRMVPAATGTYFGIPISAGTIGTIAGDGYIGGGGDGSLTYLAAENSANPGPNTSNYVHINVPNQLALDAGGGLYYADSGSSEIRRVDTSGYIIDIAGQTSSTSGATGVCSWKTDTIGDGCPAAGTVGSYGGSISATLSAPSGVTVDAFGNVTLVDGTNQVIRQVNVSKSNLFFANTAIGTTSTTILAGSGTTGNVIATIYNPSATTLTFTNITTTGNFAFKSSGSTCTTTTSLAKGQSCQLALSFTPQTAGALTGSVSIVSNALNPLTINLSGTGTQVSSTTTETITPNPAGHGQTVTMTATVTGFGTNPTGSVTFTNSGTGGTISSGAISLTPSGSHAATATYTTSALAASTYTSVIATYSGDTNYTSSTSAGTSLTISSKSLTTTSLSSSSTTPTAGSSITLTATVSGSGGPTGIVSFYNGYLLLGTSSLSGTTATLSTTDYLLGTNSLSATYNGDSNNSISSSSAVTVTASSQPVLFFTPSTISTVAGNGTGSYSGDGAAATAAQITNPQSVAVDAAGNLYIPDSGNDAIRVVNTQSSAITIAGVTIQPGNIGTIAGQMLAGVGVACSTANGTGTPATCGDNGPATSSTLNYPSNLQLDATGNIYFSDDNDNAVRVINTQSTAITVAGVTIPSGFINTVAGTWTACASPTASPACGDTGQATTATLKLPRGIALDASGDIFIADYGDYRIREVNASTGVISTVVGTGSSGFTDNVAATSGVLAHAHGITLDSSGNLYIADDTNQRIRVVNRQSSSITIAGVSIPAGYIKTITGTGTTGYPTSGSSSATAATDYPGDVLVDAAGDIYTITNSNGVYSSEVEMITPAGIVNIIAGNDPGATCTANTGLLASNCYNGDGGNAVNAQLNSGQGLALDSVGNLYIADAGNSVIRKLAGASTVASFGNESLNSTSSTLSFNVTNIGSSSLTFSNITFPSAFPKETIGSDCTSTTSLPSGSSCALGVAFDPTSGGAYSPTATISSNSINATSGSNSVYLFGTGLTAGSTTTVTPSISTTTYGTSVTVTVAVTGGGVTPTGTITLTATPSGGSATTLANAVSLVSGSYTYTGILPVGVDSVVAVYSGDSNYSGSTSSAATVTVNQATQTITFTAPTTPVTYGASSVTLSASATSSLTVAFTVDVSSTSGACSITGGTTLNFTGAGNCVIDANQAGNSTYSAAPQVQNTVVINQATQTITGFAPSSPVTYGVAPITLSVSGSGASGLPVTFSILSGTCGSLSGTNNSTLTINGVCTLTVAADQAGNSNYSSATEVTANIVVNQASQTITGFAPPSTATYGSGTITLSVTGGGASGNSVTFSVLSGPGTISSGNILTINGVGTIVVAADQAGNTNYAAATEVTASIVVSKASQTISFTAPSTPVSYGVAPIALSATGGASGSTVIFSVLSGPGTITGGTNLTVTGVGTITVAADQAGTANYNAATEVTHTVVVNQASTATSVVSTSYSIVPGTSVTLTATVTSGATGTVTFKSNGVAIGSPATLVSGTASISTSALALGTDSITAVYSGDSNYAGSTGTTSISVAYLAPTVVLSCNPTSVQPGQPTTCTATVSGSGATPTGTVSFAATSTGASQGTLGSSSLVSGVATYYGLVWNGTDVMTATYSGDANYGSGPSNTVTLSNYSNTGKLQFNWPFINWAQPVSYGASSGAWPVTLQNLTGMTVTPTIGIANSNFIITGNTCGTLTQGASCSLNVTFAPTSGGSANGTTITSALTATTSTSSQDASIPVTGIALSSALTFNWPFINFTPTVAVGATSSPWPVTMTNSSGTSTTVNSIGFSDASFAVTSDTCTGQTLGAGASCTFGVTFSPIAGDITHGGTNIISGVTLTASGNSGAVTGTLGVGGWAAAALGFNWPFVTFQSQPIGSTGTNLWPVTVTNYSGSTISSLSYNFTGVSNYQSGAFTLSNTCSSLAPGASCTFDIAPSPVSGQSVGAYSATLVVSGNGLSSPALSVSGAALQGGYTINWNQDQQASVSTIDFGPQNTANVTAGPWPITVYNNTGGTHTLTITPSLGVFTYNSSTCTNVASGSSCSFNLYFTPTADTYYNGTLTVSDGTNSYTFNTWGGANK